MNTAIIEKLAHDWLSITWKVIELEKVNLKVLQRLFRDTYDILDKLSTEKLVPKEICGLLLEMQEFSWWVGTLPDSPVHDNYQQVYTLIQALIKHYLDEPTDRQQIETLIDAIE